MNKLLIWFLELFPYVGKLKKLAYTDSLTNVPNRAAFFETLKTWDASNGIGVIYIDLNGFSEINNTLGGHHEGDVLLKKIALTFLDAFYSIHTDKKIFARMGGDEFVFAFTRHDFTHILLAGIMEQVSKYMEDIDIGYSWGGAITYSRPLDIDRVLQEADIKMYKQKRHIRKKTR